MKKIIIICALVVYSFCSAQLIPKSSVTVGGSGDFTNQPFVQQAKFSRTQTIYYPEQIKFNGEITGIRFFRAFSSPTKSPSPNTSLVFKIGHSIKEEFVSGDGFIPDSELTEIGITSYNANAFEFILIFDESFSYNGIDNLVIDVEDVNPGRTSSALAGWKGTENFNNPPTRSIVSITEEFNDGSTSTSVLIQNSFAKTQFDGNLQVCEELSVRSIDNVTNTSADFTINDNSTANHYRYVITENGEDIPETYNTTTDQQFSVSGLQASQAYYINVKSDCDAFGVTSGYRSFYFKTRPDILTVPYTIDFETDFSQDYAIPFFGTAVNAEAANTSTNGLMLNGPSYPQYLSWQDSGDPFEENRDFLRTVSIDLDLTINVTNPVLKFDISQTGGAYLRVKVKPFEDDSFFTGVANDFVYNASFDDNDFKTVSIDLSSHVGNIVTIKLEHVSSSTTNKTYLDNIQFLENDCEKITNILAETTLNTIALNWNPTLVNSYEVITAQFEDNLSTDYLTATANNYMFTDLLPAKSYKLFLRNICASLNSPWQKIYASTDPEFLEVGFDRFFNNEGSLGTNLFSVQQSESSKLEFVNSFSSNRLILHQRNSNAEWVGGDATTEAQAWNENTDFLTGFKFLIDGTAITDGSVALTFRQLHHFSSTPANSWFRILINGEQYGASYNPTTRYQDALTTVLIDLEPYLGDVISFELQHVGRTKDYFSLSAIGGDGTLIRRLVFTANLLSTNDVDASSILLYPNPVSSNLHIDGLENNSQIVIFDVNGRKLKMFNSLSASILLNLSDFKTGLYFVEIRAKERVQTLKFIKKQIARVSFKKKYLDS
jgi:hypothetical protein